MSSKEFCETPINVKPDKPAKTRYSKGYGEWDTLLGSVKQEAYLWRCSFFIVLIVLLFAIGGLVAQSFKSSVIPYVIETNADGSAKAIGPAKDNNYVVKEAEIKHFLGQFIINTRGISLDRYNVSTNLNSAYSYLRPQAANKMSEILKKEKFEDRLGQESVQVKINVVLPQGKNSYQIRWSEDTYGKDGSVKTSSKMSGIFNYEIATPKTEKELMANPLGIYINDFSWSNEI